MRILILDGILAVADYTIPPFPLQLKCLGAIGSFSFDRGLWFVVVVVFVRDRILSVADYNSTRVGVVIVVVVRIFTMG